MSNNDIDNTLDEKEIKTFLKTLENPKSVFEKVKRIIAIGDIHGDFNALIKALYVGKVINTEGKWIGNNTHLVQVGDLIDKGGRGTEVVHLSETDDSEWKSIVYLENLRQQARKNGGDVHLLLGNHELMNVTSNLKYTTDKSNKYFGGEEKRKELFVRGGLMAKVLARLFNCVVKIGDWIFSHAGILPEKLKTYGSDITRLNKDVREYLKNPGYVNDDLYDIIENENSILWNRIYGDKTRDDICQNVRDTLKIINGTDKNGGMVIGHTIQKEGIESDCDNQLQRIDVGMSVAFGKDNKKIQVLEILDNKKVNILN